MGKTADLTVVQKTIIDTLHREDKTQTFITKEAVCSQSAVSKHVNRKLSGRKKCGRKRCTTNRENRSLMRIVKQTRFKNLGELHKEWTEAGVKASRAPHTDVSRNLATVVFRGVLPGLRRRRTGLLPGGPKSSFQMRASFVFHLETKVLESGGSVEKLIAQVAWSPVLRFHSLWWSGVQCHLLVLVHCVFWKSTSLHPFTAVTLTRNNIYSTWTYFPERQQFTKKNFLLVLWSILICWDVNLWVFVKCEPKSSQLKEPKT